MPAITAPAGIRRRNNGGWGSTDTRLIILKLYTPYERRDESSPRGTSTSSVPALSEVEGRQALQNDIDYRKSGRPKVNA